MALHPRAGQPAIQADLENIPRLISAYYRRQPDINDPGQRVSFGTSGHRGCALDGSFNEAHIAAICQAIAEYRNQQGIEGPLFLGIDSHALSEPAFITAVEVLSGNGVALVVEKGRGYTPTPVISQAIVAHNQRHQDKADGILLTPSHNPPRDGGLKYNPPHGGPADTSVTAAIERRANELLTKGVEAINRETFETACSRWQERDFAEQYIAGLAQVIDLEAIQSSGLRLGVDPLGGATVAYWQRIAEQYHLDITVVNEAVDPTFRFMPLDKDGNIRMDCSSPFAMANLVALKDRFDLGLGNDADGDRHGIVTPEAGLMNPNHFLAVVIHYLFTHRPHWGSQKRIGKTLVSSALIDRVAADIDVALFETPVGFKWFVEGLSDTSIGFAGEESAGGIFLTRDGDTWATDKDGFILCLLAAEITAVTGKSPSYYYEGLCERLGKASYVRLDVPCSLEQKGRFANLTKDAITQEDFAGEPITAVLTHAPGNGAAVGGIKLCTANGWFAARPSGTENVYKIYAESFLGDGHLNTLVDEAKQLVNRALG